MTTTDDETLQSTFNILRPCDGCLHEEEIGEDLLADIRRKFACVYYAAIERAENQLKTRGLHLHDDFSFCLVIDPCYENSTHIAIVDLWADVRPLDQLALDETIEYWSRIYLKSGAPKRNSGGGVYGFNKSEACRFPQLVFAPRLFDGGRGRRRGRAIYAATGRNRASRSLCRGL